MHFYNKTKKNDLLNFFFIIKRWAMLLPMITMTMWALLSTGGLMV